LKDAGQAELQLQESRAGDRVQTERVHPRKRFGVTLARPSYGSLARVPRHDAGVHSLRARPVWDPRGRGGGTRSNERGLP
jgi:hypothetical protein